MIRLNQFEKLFYAIRTWQMKNNVTIYISNLSIILDLYLFLFKLFVKPKCSSKLKLAQNPIGYKYPNFEAVEGL